LRKELKQRIDNLQCNNKKVLKQRLDFPFDKRIKTTDIDWLQYKAKNALKQRRDIPFNRLPAIEGQTIVETTVRFSI